jgi:hypothetical protein
MIKFLFWNLNRKPLQQSVVRLAFRHDVDVLTLAECVIPPAEMLETLNRDKHLYHLPWSACEKIAIYTRFPAQFIEPVAEDIRYTFRRIALPARIEFLLGAVHFASKLNWSDESQLAESVVFASGICHAERQVGHSRTVLAGDLNMNPFDKGMVSAAGLNAVMTTQLAIRRTRTVQGWQYSFFYNPMWGRFGDTTPGPPARITTPALST